jgi:hypothetical protein
MHENKNCIEVITSIEAHCLSQEENVWNSHSPNTERAVAIHMALAHKIKDNVGTTKKKKKSKLVQSFVLLHTEVLFFSFFFFFFFFFF